VPEQLLTILNVCLLVLLYLFFLRVLAAVTSEVRDPATLARTARPGGASSPAAAVPAPAAPKPSGRSKRRAAPTMLVVREPSALAGTEHRLRPEMTIGRSPGCTVVIDDHYVSSVHSRIFRRDGSWMVEDSGSTNGTYLNKRKVTGPTVVHRGDQIQVGNMVMELR
jgi:hypothetical protein